MAWARRQSMALWRKGMHYMALGPLGAGAGSTDAVRPIRPFGHSLDLGRGRPQHSSDNFGSEEVRLLGRKELTFRHSKHLVSSIQMQLSTLTLVPLL